MPKEHTNRDYYEAIFQIRPAKEEIIDYFLEQVRDSKGMFISKIITLKTGKDFYISDRKIAAQIARRLKTKFNASIKISRKLFTQNRQTSKKVYRMTYCARFE